MITADELRARRLERKATEVMTGGHYTYLSDCPCAKCQGWFMIIDRAATDAFMLGEATVSAASIGKLFQMPTPPDHIHDGSFHRLEQRIREIQSA